MLKRVVPPAGAEGLVEMTEFQRGEPEHGMNGHAVPDLSRVVLSIDNWLRRDLPDPDLLMGSWLSTTSRALLVATTGLGKTNFGISLGMAIAAGKDFLHWQGHREARVLYIDGEMSRRLLKLRIADGVERLGLRPSGFYALSHEDIEGFSPLNSAAGQVCIERVIAGIGGVDLLLLDSVMCLISGDMKDELSWQQTLPWARSLTRRSIGQIWIHHTGHDDTRSYGTKTREWQLDTVMHLQPLERPDTDVSFSLEFRKARERTPSTRTDFQDAKVALVHNCWECDLAETERTGHASPLGLKFLDALKNALAGDAATKCNGRRASSDEAWKAEAVTLGLLDPKAKPDSARTLFNKYRRELIGANMVACQGNLTWTL